MSMITDDKMFAIEDNTDDEGMMDYYSKRGIVGTYKGIDLIDLTIDVIDKMVALDCVGEEVMALNNKSLEELGYNFKVEV